MIGKAAVHLVLLAVVVGMWASPAAGARQWSPLMLSTNGHHWVKRLDKPLFRHVVLVPGQSEVRTFYVRNRGASKARLRLQVTMHDKKDWLRSGDLRFAMGRTGDLHRLRGDRTLTHVVVPRGAARSFTVKIRYLPGATVRKHHSFNFHVKLRLTGKGKARS